VPLLFGAMAQADGLIVAALGIASQGCALDRAEAWRVRRLTRDAASGLAIHPYEAIFLSAGADAVADAVIANLVARNSLSWEGGRITQRSLFDDPHPLEWAAYLEVGRQHGLMELRQLQRFTSARTHDIAARLRGLGLTQSRSVSAAFLLVLLVPALLLVIALVRHQGVGWALIACVVASIFAYCRYITSAGVSPLGTASLENFRHHHESLGDECRRLRMPGAHLPALIALSGVEALRRFDLGDLADALTLARLEAAPDSCTCGGCGCGGE
jgi:uncharacterized protein (TIGR04222 family)